MAQWQYSTMCTEFERSINFDEDLRKILQDCGMRGWEQRSRAESLPCTQDSWAWPRAPSRVAVSGRRIRALASTL